MRSPVRSSIPVVFAALLAACGSADKVTTAPIIQAPATASVNMVSRTFTPASVDVASGAVITFTNSDGFNHNVTFASATVGTIANFATARCTAE